MRGTLQNKVAKFKPQVRTECMRPKRAQKGIVSSRAQMSMGGNTRDHILCLGSLARKLGQKDLYHLKYILLSGRDSAMSEDQSCLRLHAAWAVVPKSREGATVAHCSS